MACLIKPAGAIIDLYVSIIYRDNIIWLGTHFLSLALVVLSCGRTRALINALFPGLTCNGVNRVGFLTIIKKGISDRFLTS